MPQRIKTTYPGVFYREADRIGGKGKEKVYYVVFKQNGKWVEEKAGRQYADDMTPARAAHIRGERIEGKKKSRKQIKAEEEEKRQAELNKWTISKLWEEYEKTHAQIKGLVQDKNRYKNHIKPAFGKREPSNISSLEVRRFMSKIEKKMKPGTVKNIMELLRRIIQFGVKNQLCKGPAFTISIPKPNNIKTEDLTQDQLKALIKAIDEDKDIQAANLMRLILVTGIRRGEAFRLKWDDVDFEKGFILLCDPKGGEDQVIPMNESARSILKNHPKSDDSPYVFPGKDGEKRVEIKTSVNRIKERAKLPKDFRPLHGLRHVYASMLASSGQVDLYALQKLLTHKSPAMTQRYAHLRDEALRKASNLAGEIIANVVKNSEVENDEVQADQAMG